MNASKARAERKRLGYSTLVERQMRDPEFRAGVEAEEAVIAQEVAARNFAKLVAEAVVAHRWPAVLWFRPDVDIEKERRRPLVAEIRSLLRVKLGTKPGGKTKR
jgi:hypothetical protein